MSYCLFPNKGLKVMLLDRILVGEELLKEGQTLCKSEGRISRKSLQVFVQDGSDMSGANQNRVEIVANWVV